MILFQKRLIKILLVAVIPIIAFSAYALKAREQAPARPNLTIIYKVKFSEDPSAPAQVKMLLRGANEITHIKFLDIDENFHHFKGTGQLVQTAPKSWTWNPKSVNGEVSYEVKINRQRSIKGFDSYHGGSWIFTRTSDLFPRKDYVEERPLRIYSQVEFELPKKWQIVTAMERISEDKNVFAPRDRGNPYVSPYGWILCGDLDVTKKEMSEVDVTLASPRVMKYDPTELTELIEKSMREFSQIMRELPPRIAFIVGPDPLWRGGLSGEDSLYINQNLSLIDRDYTSTPIHELFHITQGFKKASQLSDWIIEGLAEYYSLRILYNTKQISKNKFVRGIRKFDRQGVWGVNLEKNQSFAALYNSAALVMFYIDEHLKEISKGNTSLRDVIKSLAVNDIVTNKRFVQMLSKKVSTEDWEKLIKQYSRRGKKPAYEKFLSAYESSSSKKRSKTAE